MLPQIEAKGLNPACSNALVFLFYVLKDPFHSCNQYSKGLRMSTVRYRLIVQLQHVFLFGNKTKQNKEKEKFKVYF